MAVDFAAFKAKYPELVQPADANQTRIEGCIADAILILGTPPCPKLADALILAWAANCVFKSGDHPNGSGFPESGAGAVSSKSVGSVSISYQVAQSQGDDSLRAWFKGNPYGQQYLMYQKYCYGAGVLIAP